MIVKFYESQKSDVTFGPYLILHLNTYNVIWDMQCINGPHLVLPVDYNRYLYEYQIDTSYVYGTYTTMAHESIVKRFS